MGLRGPQVSPLRSTGHPLQPRRAGRVCGIIRNANSARARGTSSFSAPRRGHLPGAVAEAFSAPRPQACVAEFTAQPAQDRAPSALAAVASSAVCGDIELRCRAPSRHPPQRLRAAFAEGFGPRLSLLCVEDGDGSFSFVSQCPSPLFPHQTGQLSPLCVSAFPTPLPTRGSEHETLLAFSVPVLQTSRASPLTLPQVTSVSNLFRTRPRAWAFRPRIRLPWLSLVVCHHPRGTSFSVGRFD